MTFASVAADISGPNPRSSSGNQYIISFINLYNGQPEAFVVSNKNKNRRHRTFVDKQNVTLIDTTNNFG